MRRRERPFPHKLSNATVPPSRVCSSMFGAFCPALSFAIAESIAETAVFSCQFLPAAQSRLAHLPIPPLKSNLHCTLPQTIVRPTIQICITISATRTTDESYFGHTTATAFRNFYPLGCFSLWRVEFWPGAGAGSTNGLAARISGTARPPPATAVSPDMGLCVFRLMVAAAAETAVYPHPHSLNPGHIHLV